MSNPQQYDAIVIGSGQAGTPLSTALAGANMHTALIERKHVGGTCVNEGCSPTKTMVRAEQHVVQEGSSPSGAQMRGAISNKRG